MIIISGSSSRNLANDLALRVDTEHVPAVTKKFPDGECYVRIERETIDEEVVIVQNSYPNDMLVELFLLQDAARNLGAKRIINVIPYFGYARQDKVFLTGEAISARVMTRHLDLEADKVITVDIHTPKIIEWFGRAEAINVQAAECIGKYFIDDGIDLVLAPDQGASGRARAVASVLGSAWDHLLKTRLSGTEVRITPSNVDARGRKVLIVDDIISTGGTIEAATRELRRLGAEAVYVACTHGLFIGGALERLRKTCDRIVATNTIEGEVSMISVAPAIASALQ
ncbi:MAG: ribose-phosphate diphosphokinase [Methanomassiliicoccales archaeon]|jgi:ribose-phosphate pyrophosphokinase|nr:ribose-phosphate diphosphokinase [Methanomassiliicoccales archaeon]